MAFVGEHEMMLLIRLGIAALLGAIIGMEREINHHPAGLRTHILVCLGSTVFILIAAGLGESARVAAGVVTGVGFLGAGAIMKEEMGVKGLTSAASIWITAAIGVAVGSDQIFLAISATLLSLGLLVSLSRIQKGLNLKSYRATLTIRGESMIGIPDMVNTILEANKIVVEYSKMERTEGTVKLTYRIRMPMGTNRIKLMKELSDHPEIQMVVWD
ncbi:MAG: MgtC/SapB family protein [Candidatus Thermoplasmatota archaeon]|nr:MgtC/SapB family protein [Candidatus Thermoplasmatota archaeon]